MPAGVYLSQENRNAIAEAVRAGETDAAIAARHGLTIKAVESIIRRMREAGVHLPRRDGNRLGVRLKRGEAAAAPKADAVAPRARISLCEDQIADALAARLDKPAIPAGSGGGDVDPPVGAPSPILCRVALSLMQRGVPRAEALHQARVFRSRHAASVAR